MRIFQEISSKAAIKRKCDRVRAAKEKKQKEKLQEKEEPKEKKKWIEPDKNRFFNNIHHFSKTARSLENVLSNYERKVIPISRTFKLKNGNTIQSSDYIHCMYRDSTNNRISNKSTINLFHVKNYIIVEGVKSSEDNVFTFDNENDALKAYQIIKETSNGN